MPLCRIYNLALRSSSATWWVGGHAFNLLGARHRAAILEVRVDIVLLFHHKYLVVK